MPKLPILSALILLLYAGGVAARDPVLSLPVACALGETCFIQNYFDHDGGPGAGDFTCGLLSYDGHDGTDFALPSLAAMAAGVAVTPAAPGTVRAVRDGMPDIYFDATGAPDITGRDCGNGVLVDHGGGWETQYCHLRQGSVAVRPGQRVGLDTLLGQVGLSGRTQFPHLHLSVRKDGTEVDPFAPDGIVTCREPPARSLWSSPPPYQAGGLLALGVADRVPDYAEVRAGPARVERMQSDSPALVLWAYAFGGRAGDVVRLRLDGPGGTLVDETATLDRAQAQFFRAAGKRARGDWPVGDYTGEALLLREGATLSRREIRFTVR